MNQARPQDFDRPGLIARLQAEDGAADTMGVFPEGLWTILKNGRAPLWSIPTEFGGDGCGREDLLERFSAVAQGSLTAAFILSQHDAAVRRLLAAGESTAARRWLGAIVAGEAFTTIGVSQLTTSRRLGSKALVADAQTDGTHRLVGAMPWVTAAERADVFVTGAVRDDGNQILLALPASRSGIEVKPAFGLAALGASRTAEVLLSDVLVEPTDLLAGPSTDVMSHGSAAGTGGLETSALALGQARAAIGLLGNERSSELTEPVDQLRSTLEETWDALLATSRGDQGSASSTQIRSRANNLALRATQACLTARRGRGFLLTDPAQRWARQALFFLVWSCPSPVANAAIRDLAGLCSL